LTTRWASDRHLRRSRGSSSASVWRRDSTRRHSRRWQAPAAEKRAAPSPHHAACGLASTICWPISAYLENEVGWRMVCFIWAAAHITIGLRLNRFLVTAGTQRVPSAQDGTQRTSGRIPTPQDHAMPPFAFVFAVTWFTNTAMAAHLPLRPQVAALTDRYSERKETGGPQTRRRVGPLGHCDGSSKGRNANVTKRSGSATCASSHRC
jgi:hypothetical protein